MALGSGSILVGLLSTLRQVLRVGQDLLVLRAHLSCWVEALADVLALLNGTLLFSGAALNLALRVLASLVLLLVVQLLLGERLVSTCDVALAMLVL